MQKDVAYVSGSIITLLFLLVIAYHVYTEILIKSRLWVVLNELIVKSKSTIRDVASIHRVVTSAQPLSYTTSVVEAPIKNDSEQPKLKYAGYAEPNLRELLLESSVDGFNETANFSISHVLGELLVFSCYINNCSFACCSITSNIKLVVLNSSAPFMITVTLHAIYACGEEAGEQEQFYDNVNGNSGHLYKGSYSTN